MVAAFFRYLLSGAGPVSESPLQAGGFIKSHPELEKPDVGLHFIPVFMVDHGRKKVPGTGVALHVCQLRPASRGVITLRSNSPYDAPHIDANYLDDEEDLEVMIKGVRIARKIFKTGVFAEALGTEFETSRGRESEEDIADFVRSTAETMYHPVGTCKMGHDPMAVVDHELRVHGVNRLRVVDASVMPTLVAGNTNAPTIMIAEKAADMIRINRG